MVARLDDVQIQYVVESHNILLFQDADVAIDVQVFQVLLPAVEANYAYYVAKNLLQSGALAIVFICTVQGALDDDLVKVSKDFVLLEDHGSCPRTVVDGEVQHPFMGGGLPDVVQKLFQVLLVFKHIFVVVRHLGH